MVSILSGRFQYSPDGFNTVRTVSILSRRFQYCPDSFNTVRTVSIQSGRFPYCPDGFNTVWTVSLLNFKVNDEHCIYALSIYAFACHIIFNTCGQRRSRRFYMSRERITAFLTCHEKVDPRTSSGKKLRVKSCYPESFRFLCLWA